MKKFSEFNIPFAGLNLGIHRYDFKLDKAFFNQFEYCEITDGMFDVEVDLDKKTNMMILDFNLFGKVNSDCDRCGGELMLPVAYKDRIYVKFGEEQSEDESILMLPTNAYEFNIASLLEEFAVLSLPVRKVHEKGKCDKVALKRLEKLKNHDTKEIDPRWDKLKGLI